MSFTGSQSDAPVRPRRTVNQRQRAFVDNRVLLRRTQKAAVDVLRQQRKQVQTQAAQYDAMASVVADVKRSYLPEGAAKNIGQQKLAPEPEFKAYLAALQSLENGKRGLDPRQPVPLNQAKALKDNCDAVVTAAHAYLTRYNTLQAPDQQSKESLSKKRYCEESLLSARHYGMAMDIEMAGRPTAEQPWDRETEVRMAGVRAAFSYEQGYQQATALGDDGSQGASDSYWIKSKSVVETQDGQTGQRDASLETNKRGDFIFKPAAGEDPPRGSNDRKGAGAVKEALAAANAKLFAAQTGIDLGVPETSVVSIGQYAIRGGDPAQPPMIGSAQQHAGSSTQIKDLPPDALKTIKPEQAQKIALMDIMSLSVDRHEGNIMVDNADPTDPKLIPIDHGGTLPSRADFAETKSRMAVGYSLNGGAKTVNTLLKIPAAFEKFDADMLAKIDLLNPAEIEQGMKDQRDALARVHPDLDPAGKVGDESFHMSKRAMMFLKRAATTLSPAEIQLALVAYGEELFDAPDNTFDALADTIIADAAPKKPAYQEFLAYSPDKQEQILKWLHDNGWSVTSEVGEASPQNLMMRDPVNALKLYKSQTVNPNPPVADALPAAPFPVNGNADADDTAKNDMRADFPGLEDCNAAQWKQRLAAWTAINAKGGIAEYRRAVAATGATAEEGAGGANGLRAVYQALVAWEDINKPANQAALAALQPQTTTRSIWEILQRAIKAAGWKTLGAQQLNAADAAGALIDTTEALRDAAKRVLGDVTALLGRLTDTAVIAALTDTSQAADFADQAEDIEARLDADNIEDDDVAQAEAEVRTLDAYLSAFALKELNTEALRLASAMDERAFTGQDAINIANFKTSAERETSLPEAIKTLDQLLIIDKKSANTPLKPVVPQAAQPVGADDDDQQSETDSETDTDSEKDDADDGGNAPAGSTLPGFDWSQKNASAVKKAAIAAGMMKDKDTGMTGALKAINKARGTLGSMKANLANDKKIAVLEKTFEAYTKFGIFIGSKLRMASNDRGWVEYCNTAASLVDFETEVIKARIKSLKETGLDA